MTYRTKPTSWRSRRAAAVWVSVLVSIATLSLPAGANNRGSSVKLVADGSPTVVAPTSPVGTQLSWLLGVGSHLPISSDTEAAHFDKTFIAAEPLTQLNAAFESLGSTGAQVTLLGLSDVTATALKAEVKIGAITYNIELAVDTQGLISGLYFALAAPIPIPKVRSWSQVDKDLHEMAPDSSFLAAELNKNGTCSPIHAVAADTPRPLGSMFKLFVLGALANVVKDHSVTWNQKLTLTASVKVGGSGVLQSDPAGTTLTVQQTALKMI
ncbi:MAG: serine hydrolase, partial [Acidimicrobiales bacterium]